MGSVGHGHADDLGGCDCLGIDGVWIVVYWERVEFRGFDTLIRRWFACVSIV